MRNFRLKKRLPDNAAKAQMTYGDVVESVQRAATPTWSDDRRVVCPAPNPVKSKGAGPTDRRWQAGWSRVCGWCCRGELGT